MQKQNIEVKRIEKSDFKKYITEIEQIHNENAFPNNGYLVDEDYIKNADIMFIVTLNNKIIAYASLNPLVEELVRNTELLIGIEKKNIQIEQLAVKKINQDRGIGSILLDKIKEYCKEVNISYIYLYTMKENEKAQKFYLKNGFKYAGLWVSEEDNKYKSYFYEYEVK